MSSQRHIFHFVHADDYQSQTIDGIYMPPSLEKEGFIHLSPVELVARVANTIIPGRTGFILLEVDTARVPHRIVWENLEGGTDLFPHIYGPLPIDAIVATHSFEPGENGEFRAPVL